MIGKQLRNAIIRAIDPIVVTGHKDYRTLLRNEFETRAQHNPRYSLRAFARDLGLASSRLSEIFNNQEGLSRSSAAQVAKRLGYGKEETEVFCDLVESVHARSKAKRAIAGIRLKNRYQYAEFNQLQMDHFKVLSDWHHFAILELTTIAGFRSEVTWISKQLGVSPLLVSTAIERLERIGLLSKKSGKWVTQEPFTATPSGIPSESIKKFHKQILEKAITALHLQSVDERDFSAMVMAIPSEKIPWAKSKIKEFRRELSKNFESEKNKDQVYCLSIQLFNLLDTNNCSKLTGEEK